MNYKLIELAFGWRCGHIWPSHYTWGSVTTPHDFGGVLGRPLDTFFWALTIPWSRLLAHVWSGPHVRKSFQTTTIFVNDYMNYELQTHRTSIWVKVWSHTAFTLHSRIRDHTTWFWRCPRTVAFGHFLLDSHNPMVTALDSCVKWPQLAQETLAHSKQQQYSWTTTTTKLYTKLIHFYHIVSRT